VFEDIARIDAETLRLIAARVAEGVMVENILRALANRNLQSERMQVIAKAVREVARPVFFAVLIIMLVYVPVLLLGGVEGKILSRSRQGASPSGV
jgi:Cu/Ag efflux pump CusA